jgi:diguanylate cyclase (GGDEF)-like protein
VSDGRNKLAIALRTGQKTVNHIIKAFRNAKLLAVKYLRGSIILTAITIVSLWGCIAFKFAGDLSSDTREAERINNNIAILFEENVLRSIGEIDKALLYLRRTLMTSVKSEEYDAIIRSADVLSEIIVQVAVIDERGIMRASNAGEAPTKPVDLSDREHFRVHTTSTDDRLFISKPIIGRASGKWSVQLTRKLVKSDGSFGGVVVASLDPAHFTRFYSKIDMGSNGALTLVGTDGIVRASSTTTAGFGLGSDITGSKLFQRVSVGADESFRVAVDDQVDALLVSVRQVRGNALAVMVSTEEEKVFADARGALRANVIAGLILSAVIGFCMRRVIVAEQQVSQKSTQLQLTLDNMSQGIALITPDLEVPVLNRRFVELLDLPESFLKAPPSFRSMFEILQARGEFDQEEIPEGISPLAFYGPDDVGNRFSHYERQRPNGVILEVRSNRLASGGFVRTCTDITHNRQAQSRAARLAAEDALTGLANRRAFHAELQRLTRSLADDAGAQDAVEGFSILCLDLDRFKSVNDTLGHPVGDLLLQAVAQRLRAAIRSTDILARLGGDEFAILLPGASSTTAPQNVARRIVESIRNPYLINGHQIQIGVSIGIAMSPRDGADADQLLVAGDLALYAAKSSGRTTFKFFEKTMDDRVKARRQIEIDLENALSRKELELHYQPIIDLGADEVVGFEALARWNHPEKGLISPADFIPVAEECGLIVEMGKWALREACASAMGWPTHLKVAVNLSPVQFSNPNLVDVIKEALSATGLAPDRLELEITETILMQDSESTIAALHEMKALGVRIAMDDFGTGYSSLSYLQKFPFDKIKIDRAFVSKLDERINQRAIVSAVIDIASALNMSTTAEGVETIEEKNTLAMLGCGQVQGYLFSRPIQESDIGKFLLNWNKTMLEAA